MTTFHPLVDQLKKILIDNGVLFETFEHAPTLTSKEAGAVRPGYTVEDSANALVVRVKSHDGARHFVLLVLRGSKRIDNHRVEALLRAKDTRFATKEEFAQITGGVASGGLPPFGNLFHLETFVDSDVLTMPRIVFNAGDPCYSIALKTEDMIRVVHPHIGKFSVSKARARDRK